MREWKEHIISKFVRQRADNCGTETTGNDWFGIRHVWPGEVIEEWYARTQRVQVKYHRGETYVRDHVGNGVVLEDLGEFLYDRDERTLSVC